MPHVHCYLARPALVWTMFTTDMLIGLAYVGISLMLWALVRAVKIEFSMVVLCFGIFIGACGATHFMEVYTLWNPSYWWSAAVKAVTAVASVGTGIYLYRLRRPLVQVAEAAKLSEQRRLDLEALTTSLEQRVAERTRELQEALRIRDDFLAVASHELRTPVTALKLKLDLQQRLAERERSENNQRVAEFAGEINNQVLRLTRLIEGLLDVSRIRSGRLSLSPEDFDLSALLERTVQSYVPALKDAGIEVETAIEPGLSLHGDPIRIEQVVANLLINAIRDAPGQPLRVEAGREGDRVRLVFQDEGPGIHVEHASRIFNRFERLNPSTHREGMGVGLYVAQAIVHAHQGRIELEPSERGARFVIRLPQSLTAGDFSAGVGL